ncbi:MAG TPA: DUF5666 domain-containing protein [Thermoanaerobaculia bacterium]|nr:DUF5666 domain-containing protein [Thermoanaerobaculia bacterium]
MGDILGGGSPTNGNSNYEIRGTVESVDPNNQSIWLRNVDGHRTMLSNSGSGNSRGSEVRVYFDNQTTVEYQGRAYRPEDLERGDEVLVRVDESGNRLIATSMSVTYNAAGNTSNGNNGSWPSSGGYNNSVVRGTVRYVDTSRGTIEVDRGGSMSSLILDVDTGTPVYFNGQTYRVGDLERGDEVEIRVRETGGTRVLAQDITVTRSVQGGGTYGNSSNQRATSTVRGTIRQIDTSRRTIELEQTTWMSGFSGGGSSSNRVVVQYSDNTQVDVNGRLHPMAGLERGDIVSVEVSGNSSRYWAERVYLVHDVNNRR